MGLLTQPRPKAAIKVFIKRFLKKFRNLKYVVAFIYKCLYQKEFVNFFNGKRFAK